MPPDPSSLKIPKGGNPKILGKHTKDWYVGRGALARVIKGGANWAHFKLSGFVRFSWANSQQQLNRYSATDSDYPPDFLGSTSMVGANRGGSRTVALSKGFATKGWTAYFDRSLKKWVIWDPSGTRHEGLLKAVEKYVGKRSERGYENEEANEVDYYCYASLLSATSA